MAVIQMDETIRHACEAGVTTVAAGLAVPMSLVVTFMVYKTYGNCIDDMVIKKSSCHEVCFLVKNPNVYIRNLKLRLE